MKKLRTIFLLLFSKDYFIITRSKNQLRVENNMPTNLIAQSGKAFYIV